MYCELNNEAGGGAITTGSNPSLSAIIGGLYIERQNVTPLHPTSGDEKIVNLVYGGSASTRS